MSGGPEVGAGWRDDGTMYSLTKTSRHGIAHSLTSEGHDASEDGTGRGTPIVNAVVSHYAKSTDSGATNLLCGPLGGGNDGAGRRSEDDPNLVTGSGVRRLTPTECCRLQGFPDDWFGTPNEPPDSPRYRALGDAVTVRVAEWIGRRIMEAHHADL